MDKEKIWQYLAIVTYLGLMGVLINSIIFPNLEFAYYTNTAYTAADIPPIAIDAIGTAGVQVIALAGLIVLALILEYVYKKVPRW